MESVSANQPLNVPEQKSGESGKATKSELKTKGDAASETENKNPKKATKTLYVSKSELIRNAHLGGKSLIGNKPELSPANLPEDDIGSDAYEEDSQAPTAKDKSKSSKPDSSAKSDRTDSAKKGNTSERSAVRGQNKDQVTGSKNKDTPTAAKETNSKNVNNNPKTSESKSNSITTQKEMDEFIESTLDSVNSFKSSLDDFGEDLGSKEIFKRARNQGNETKKSSSEKESNRPASAPAAPGFIPGSKKQEARPREEGSNKPQLETADKAAPGPSGGRAGQKAGEKQSDKKVPEHIKQAKEYTNALQGNINSIVNKASLQNLINMYLNTRGSYAIKIMLMMQKLKDSKSITITANLEDAKGSRSVASDRQIRAIKDQAEKLDEAKKKSKQMKIIGLAVAILAMIVAIVVTVVTAGAGGGLVCCCIGLIVAVIGLTLAVVNFIPVNMEGTEMGAFDAMIYSYLRKDGASQKDARTKAMYISMGIQLFLVVVSLGTSIAGASRVVLEGAKKVVDVLVDTLPGLLKILTYFEDAFKFLLDATVGQVRMVLSVSSKIVQLIQGLGAASTAALGYFKVVLEVEATELHAKITGIMGLFAQIEMQESIVKDLMHRNAKILGEAASSVMKTLDAEYQAIKLLNVKSKVA